jgi:DNA-binding XRE family transcriptional regulator
VDDGSLSCIERGLKLPGIRTLLRIFAALHGRHLIISDTKEPGCRIHLLRSNFLLTQTQLGALIGVDNVRISRWEHGTALPSLAALRRLCRAFGLGLSFFSGQMAQAN